MRLLFDIAFHDYHNPANPRLAIAIGLTEPRSAEQVAAVLVDIEAVIDAGYIPHLRTELVN